MTGEYRYSYEALKILWQLYLNYVPIFFSQNHWSPKIIGDEGQRFRINQSYNIVEIQRFLKCPIL